MENLSILSLISDASTVVKAVMAVLLLLSLLGWALIFALGTRLGQAQRHDTAFLAWFENDTSLANKHAELIHGDTYGLETVFLEGFSAPSIDMAERRLRGALGRAQASLERGISTLASIGSVSPYIGLFGTVWGIMNAFLGLSTQGQATLAAVAPGIAEALVATAIGLFAAIPAVLAYNHFSAKATQIYEARALFADELLGLIKGGMR